MAFPPNAIPTSPPVELTQDEKAYAGLAHALMLSTWWIGPLIIFLIERSSRFGSFHGAALTNHLYALYMA